MGVGSDWNENLLDQMAASSGGTSVYIDSPRKIVDIFKGKILDVAPKTLTIEVTGPEEKVQGMIELLGDFGIREVVRSGKIAISRETKAISLRKKRA